ncbi:hypothetical protein JHK84_035632 [Glycine max]|nr:hypothetical protein JHK86_035350 [Glycine max]KAG5129235.1 hypothetical protein JHK84_035632 [Glycine max]
MVRAFEILCPFFNIRPSVPVFLFFFQIKPTGKIGWISLNNVSKKLFEFDSHVFFHFKDHFFKVLATGVMVDGIMGDFAWRPLVKQVEPTGGIVPLFVSPIVIVAKVTPNAPSSALAKRK